MAKLKALTVAAVLVVAPAARAVAGSPLPCGGFFQTRVRVGVPLIDGRRDFYHVPSLQLQHVSAGYASRYSDYLEYLQARAYVAGQKAAEQQQQPQVSGVLQQRCAGCHSGDDPKGGLRIEEITCDQVIKVLSWVGSVSDPPAGGTMQQQVLKLRAADPQVKQALMSELLQLRKGR